MGVSPPLEGVAADRLHGSGSSPGLDCQQVVSNDPSRGLALHHRASCLNSSEAAVPAPTFRTLALSGPAATVIGNGAVNLNGIQATANGKTLIVAHSATAQLATVDPATGASATIAGVSVPNVDGIVLEAGRLWAVQNFSNQVSRIRLAPDLPSGVVEAVITSPLFQVPTTAARFGSRLAVVNAKFDTGIPPTADQFEVVVVDR